jgi:hypothetical protein
MDLMHLSISLGDMLSELDESKGIWGHVRSLVIHENWAGIAEFYGNEFAETVKRLVSSIGMEESLKLLEKLSKEDADKLSQLLSEGVKQALKNASSFQLRGSLGEKLIQFHNRDAHGIRQSTLLAVAFADRLTDLVFPATDRAAKLTDLIVKQKPSPQAEKYLEEACFCYFYELYSASAVMCRFARVGLPFASFFCLLLYD